MTSAPIIKHFGVDFGLPEETKGLNPHSLAYTLESGEVLEDLS